MFRSSTIIRELALNLAKVIFTTYVKTFGQIMSLFIMRLCGSMSWNGVQSHSAQHATHTRFHDKLPHNRVINNDVISPNVLT